MRPESRAADLVSAAREHGVRDERVLAAIAATPRSAFAPPGHAEASYSDLPLPIPHGMVTTQPSLVAAMIEGLGGPGGEEDVILFERIPQGLRQLRTLTTARFVRLQGRYGATHPPRTLADE